MNNKTEDKKMNIYQRINEIRKKVTYIQKDAKVTGYKAVTHDQVTASLRSALVEHGVIVTQSMIDSSFTETGAQTNSGAKYNMYQAKYLIKFINMDDPGDFLEVQTEAQALDHGDKAIGKAMSYAVKSTMLKTFSLETGESDEGRQDDLKAKQESKNPLTEDQVKQLEDLITETESNKFKFLQYFKVDDLSELKSGQFQQARSMLEAKK